MAPADREAPSLHYAFAARVAVGPEEHIGHGSGDEALFVPITGGSVDGPRLRGTILAGGGDWMVKRGEVYALEARYLIRTTDGALIDVVNRGFWRETPGGLYYRTSPVFRTDAPAHRWLAETVFVGLAREEGGDVCIRFYAVD
jgi:uncharacterized protein DUF3237